LTFKRASGVLFVGRNCKLMHRHLIRVGRSLTLGDNVEINTENGIAIARGLVNYSADEIRRIMGCKTAEIAALLGSKEFDEVVHRDNLVVL
jgi:glutamate 5-kinase